MERRASCSPRSRHDSAVCLRGQVILQGIAPVSIGGFPGVKRVLLSVTVHCSHEQQRCNLLADPLGRTQLLLAPRPWEDVHAYSHLLVESDPVSPDSFLLSVPFLPLQKIHFALIDIPIANSQSKYQVVVTATRVNMICLPTRSHSACLAPCQLLRQAQADHTVADSRLQTLVPSPGAGNSVLLCL